MAGNAPHAALHGEATHPQPGLVEVVLRNDGDADAALPASLALRARGARVIAADALGGWRLAPPADGAPVFLPPAAAGILAPGRRLVVGWVRFDRDTEVSVEIRP
jgi:hypothetical protein